MTTDTTEKPQNVKAPPGPADLRARLAERKAQLNTIIETETTRRAAATLDGQAYDPAPLRAAQDELAAVADAEQEFDRRAARLDTAAAKAEQRKNVAQLRALLAEWLDGIDEQELAARNLVDLIRRGEGFRADLQKLHFELTSTTPTLLVASEHELRRSRALSALLRAFKKGCPSLANESSYGEMSLRPGLADAADSWSAAERQLAEDIETRLKELEK